jgi:hypothetical protein
MQLSAATKRKLIRLALEIVLYALLVFTYLFLILRFFTAELVTLFKHDLVLYAGLALGLMVFQGIFLESVTTFLIDRLEL